jgi:hypothetical protein
VCIFWKQCKLAMFVPKFWHPLGTKFDPSWPPWVNSGL